MAVRGLLIVVALTFAAVVPRPALASVIVFSNHSEGKVSFTLVRSDGRQTKHVLERWDVVPVPVSDAVTLVMGEGKAQSKHPLQVNGVYYFRTIEEKLTLAAYPLPGLPVGKPDPKPPPDKGELFCTIPVKIFVDDKEPTVQRIWEKRYRDRLAAASAIIERHCRVRFKVVSVGTWTSNPNATDMQQLIDEFQRVVKPDPARLAIGYTGQYRTLKNDKHMGGICGPFRSHLLIREWNRQMAEPERLEILVHELGHFLGATHSGEPRSVMRPDISDRQSRAKNFNISFDAPNTLAMYLIGEELRDRPLTLLSQVSAVRKESLRAVYTSLAAELPKDPASPRFLFLLDHSPQILPLRPQNVPQP
jgi:hypothetical protein